MALLVSLGAGMWIWVRKKMQTRRGRCWVDPDGRAGMRGIWGKGVDQDPREEGRALGR